MSSAETRRARDQASDWLLRLQADPENSQVTSAWRKWLDASEENARAWQLTERVWQLSGQLPPHVAPVRTLRRRRRHSRPALAACLLIGLLLIGIWPQADRYHALNAVLELQLEDGSKIALAPGTSVQVRFSAKERHLQLSDGEAFFEVARDQNRAFVVEANGSQIRVTGTAFELRSSPARLQVTVDRGSVEVSDPQLTRPLALAAGQSLRLSRDSGSLSLDQSDKYQSAWRDGWLIAEQDRLDSLLQRLDQMQPGVTLVLDSQLAARRVSGAFHLNQPDAAMAAMLDAHNAEVEHLGRWLRLVRPR